jgi:uncharacterized protein YecT (DUF1311 family)
MVGLFNRYASEVATHRRFFRCATLQASFVSTFLGTWLLWAGVGQAASFDCKKAASRIEHLICDEPDLNSFDSQLEGAYRGALDRATRPVSVKNMQLAWLKRREACPDVKCMSDAYQQQITLLTAIVDKPSICNGAGSTPEVEACAAEHSRRADRELARYIAAARKKLIEEAQDAGLAQSAKAVLVEFDASQAAWVAFRQAECSAVYTRFGDGTIRGTMYQSCWQSVTKSRTAMVWSIWLQFMDSTPPLMPKPEAP